MSDLISRQDAIDALAKFVPYMINDMSTESYTNGLTDAYNLICQLLSADRPIGEWVTELVNDSPILAKDLVDDEFNPYDEECMRCKHLKLQCEFVPSYCKYERR